VWFVSGSSRRLVAALYQVARLCPRTCSGRSYFAVLMPTRTSQSGRLLRKVDLLRNVDLISHCIEQ
jgi:hypothetical protein